MTFTLLLFDSGVCLPFNNGNSPYLKRDHVKRRKLKFEPEKFSIKKKQKKSITFITLKKRKSMKSSFVKVQTAEVNQHTEKKILNQFFNMATKPTKHEQIIINQQFSLKQTIPC